MMRRRAVLGLLGGAALAPRLQSRATSALSEPAGQLETYVRIRGSLGDAVVFDHVTGSVHAAVEGEAPRLLFNLEGLQVSRYRREGPERFAMRTRYIGLLTDPLTGERLEHFANPWTGARREVPVSSYGPSTVWLLPGGVDYGLPAAQTPAVSRREFRREGGWVHVTESIASASSRDQPDFDVITFSARAADLGRPAPAFVPAVNGFTAVERWRPWMAMGDRPGMLIWHVRGTKLDRPDEVPGWLRQEAEGRWGAPIGQAVASTDEDSRTRE